MAWIYGRNCRECGASNDECYSMYWVTGGKRLCCDPCTDAQLDWWGTPHVEFVEGLPDDGVAAPPWPRPR